MFKIFSAVSIAALILSGSAVMAQQKGDTSGPAAGSDVKPSTAIQKENRSASEGKDTQAGAPGVEAKPGTESGSAPAKPAK